MKKLTILLLLLFTVWKATPQNNTGVYHLDSIPVYGDTLTNGWTYMAGDNTAWATPDYNDKDWQASNPTKEWHHLPELKNAGIGWFRLRLKLDSAMLNKTVAFVISGLGASEIYLNGQLLFTFGTVSSDYKKEKTRFYTKSLLSLKFNNQTDQVLAIRHSFNKKNLYLKFTFKRPVAQIILKEIDQAFADHVKDNNFDATLRSIQVSFYLPLGFLLIFLFLAFRLNREYLFSGIFCFCMFAAILMHIFSLSEPTSVSRSNYLLYATQIFYIIGPISFLHGTYILYNQKKSWLYFLIVIYGCTSLVLYFISYDLSGIFNTFFFPLINIEYMRLNGRAYFRKRKGAWILFITSLVLNLSLIIYIAFTLLGKFQAAAFLQATCFIIPGIGLSLFYAGEFARTASALRLRAIEVEELSHEMITKEKEKQQILGAQNETLEKQVAERTVELSQSLKDLKETQNQLFQREKMASLGELTAGIAHEIQNPLNFVNNFSEVNKELLEEMKMAIDKGNSEEVKTIANDVIYNQEKITEHGKRADSIVKGMLQHSRSAGAKELSDINTLIDEYLRLAFHGLRAKDKSFNVTMKTDFDQRIEKVNIAPHDIGRVVLNLITNAFYSVTEKERHAGEDYEPRVVISTKKIDDKIEIIVKDNGNGIPEKILDKIFQPFFTTKPTGQGTGLGLSISYDIIKAHGGELKVETREGEGVEFIIQLPV